jgi:hypothetical protein
VLGDIVGRAALSCLLLAGCNSESALAPDLSAASDLAAADDLPTPQAPDLSVAPDLSAASDLAAADDLATPEAPDLSVAPDDLSLVQPVPLPDGGAVLAPPGDTAQSGPVDGIFCETNEQLLFHIHAHLQMNVNGEEELVAAGVGIGPPLQLLNGIVIGGSCFSWLHTHDESGIIHIESPVSRTFTLGNFFDIWGQPLSPTQVGPAQGRVTAFVNGALFNGDPRTIALDAYAIIQLDVGAPLIAPQPYTWPPGY